jgi:hypothetical protein
MTDSRQRKCECDNVASVLSTFYKDHKRVYNNTYSCSNCDEKFKRCSQCKLFKNFNLFYKLKYGKFGLKHLCKLCVDKSSAQYRKNNSEEVKEYNQKNYKKNREKNIKRAAKYYKNNRENRIKYAAKYQKNNSEKIRKRRQNYYKNNPGIRSEYHYNTCYYGNENLIEFAKLLHNLKKEKRNAVKK